MMEKRKGKIKGEGSAVHFFVVMSRKVAKT